VTEIVLQVQGAEPRCFLAEVMDGNGKAWVFSVWALSAFDALEQARRALPLEETLGSAVRGGELRRVALCLGIILMGGVESYACAVHCTSQRCACSFHRIGVLS
jgi:hypothetical protein